MRSMLVWLGEGGQAAPVMARLPTARPGSAEDRQRASVLIIKTHNC